MQSPEMVKITSVIEEATDIITLTFNYRYKEPPVAGQFLMGWLPGIDEIPIAYSVIPVGRLNEYGITIAKVGVATEHFHSLKMGDMVGIRGPYGHGFDLGKAKRVLVAGGGIGMAPLAPAVEMARRNRKNVQVIIGAKTADGLLFINRMKDSQAKVYLTTDDGSAGEKGLVTDLAEKLIEKNNYDLVLACGPEPMLVKLVEFCNSRELPILVSLERYMKCGMGICDSCAIDGFHVCKDGPVFEGDLLAKIDDFGKFKRDATGRRIKI